MPRFPRGSSYKLDSCERNGNAPNGCNEGQAWARCREFENDHQQGLFSSFNVSQRSLEAQSSFCQLRHQLMFFIHNYLWLRWQKRDLDPIKTRRWKNFSDGWFFVLQEIKDKHSLTVFFAANFSIFFPFLGETSPSFVKCLSRLDASSLGPMLRTLFSCNYRPLLPSRGSTGILWTHFCVFTGEWTRKFHWRIIIPQIQLSVNT